MLNFIKIMLLIFGCSVGCESQGFESSDVFSEQTQQDQTYTRQSLEQQKLSHRQLAERTEFNSHYQGIDAQSITDAVIEADKILLKKHTRELEELRDRHALENTQLKTVSKTTYQNFLDWFNDYFYNNGDLANAKDILSSGIVDRKLAANGTKTGDWFADKIKLKAALNDLTTAQRLSVINDYLTRAGFRFDYKIPDAFVQTLNEMLPDGEKLSYVQKKGRIIQRPKNNNMSLSSFANSFRALIN